MTNKLKHEEQVFIERIRQSIDSEAQNIDSIHKELVEFKNKTLKQFINNGIDPQRI